MPRDGYTSVTLPDEVVELVDEHKSAINARSRAEAIRHMYGTTEQESIEGQLESIEGRLKDLHTELETHRSVVEAQQ